MIFQAGLGPGSTSRDAANWLSSRLSRRYSWLRMVFPGARLFRAPIWCTSGGGGTREAGSTAAKSLAAISRVSTHQIRQGWQLDRPRARRVLNPCARESKERTGGFLRSKLIADYGMFSFYKGRQGAANGQDSWGFSRDAQGFGRLDAGSRACFTSSRPPRPWTSIFQLSLFLYNVWP